MVAESADDVLLVYAGRAVEYGPCKEILSHPEMPYNWGLLASVPDVTADTEQKLIPIPGKPQSLLGPPSGCALHPRCAFGDRVPGRRCYTEVPELRDAVSGGIHTEACHLEHALQNFDSEIRPVMAPDLTQEG